MTRFAFGTQDWSSGVAQGQQAAETAMANLLRQRQMGLNEEAALRDKWVFDQAQQQAQLVKQQRENDALIQTYAGMNQPIPDHVFASASENGRKFALDTRAKTERKMKLTEEAQTYERNGLKPSQAVLSEMRSLSVDMPFEWNADETSRATQTLQGAEGWLTRQGYDINSPEWQAAKARGDWGGIQRAVDAIEQRRRQAQFAAGLATFQQTGDPTGLLGPGVMPQGAQLGVVQDQRAAAANFERMRNDNQAYVDLLVQSGMPTERATKIGSLPQGMRGEVADRFKAQEEAAKEEAAKAAAQASGVQTQRRDSALAEIDTRRQDLNRVMEQLALQMKNAKSQGNESTVAKELGGQMLQVQKAIAAAERASAELKQIVDNPNSKSMSEQDWAKLLPSIKQGLGLSTGNAYSDAAAMKWLLNAMGEETDSQSP